jgi:serine/threonine protein kinase
MVKLDIPALPTDEPVGSLTKLWQDELADRFSSTLFVPLAGGAYLQSGRYKVKSQLTFGGGSAIYLGRDGNGTRIVIKEAVLPESVDAEAKAKALEMFDREAKLLMKLNDARVARLLDTFVERGRHYLVLEYIAGTDLRSYVKEQGPQCEEFVWNWARELADILAYLHSQNPPIVHRDVSPDNIIVRMDGSLALIDFGAANQLLGTATGTVVGKQAYIAPEQFRGHATPQSDIYGLGATLYFLACGKDPLALSQSFPKESVPALSEEFDDLVANCTAMELEERFSDVQELKEAIEDGS